MGYTTTFDGKISIDPPLNPQEIRYLREFAETRHCRRSEGPYALGGGDAHFPDYNEPHPGQPGLWCSWVPSDDGTALEWSGVEKFYHSEEWMSYLIDTFLKPGARLLHDRQHPHTEWTMPEALNAFTCDHVLNGVITAQGEEHGDVWSLYVNDNQVSDRDGHHPLTAPLSTPGTFTLIVEERLTVTREDLAALGYTGISAGTSSTALAQAMGAQGFMRVLDRARGNGAELKGILCDEDGETTRVPIAYATQPPAAADTEPVD